MYVDAQCEQGRPRTKIRPGFVPTLWTFGTRMTTVVLAATQAGPHFRLRGQGKPGLKKTTLASPPSKSHIHRHDVLASEDHDEDASATSGPKQNSRAHPTESRSTIKTVRKDGATAPWPACGLALDGAPAPRARSRRAGLSKGARTRLGTSRIQYAGPPRRRVRNARGRAKLCKGIGTGLVSPHRRLCK